MARSIVYGIAVLLMLGPAVSANRAQDSLLQEMYGQGVHAYFAGKYDQAHELFTTAIDQGSQDPRCYYFRGLAYAKLGRPDEADADYKRGAEFEAGGAAVQINVGQALQRVQGNLRLQLEEYRYSARLAARLKEVKEKKERYEQMQRNEPNVLRSTPPPAAASEAPKPPAPDATDPFAAGAGTAAAPAAPPLRRLVLIHWRLRLLLPRRQQATRLLIRRNPSRCRQKVQLLTLLRHQPIRSALRCRPRPPLLIRSVVLLRLPLRLPARRRCRAGAAPALRPLLIRLVLRPPRLRLPPLLATACRPAAADPFGACGPRGSGCCSGWRSCSGGC